MFSSSSAVGLKWKAVSWLEGDALEGYLHDMNMAVRYAVLSRELMGETILQALGLHAADGFATIHNYIDNLQK